MICGTLISNERAMAIHPRNTILDTLLKISEYIRQVPIICILTYLRTSTSCQAFLKRSKSVVLSPMSIPQQFEILKAYCKVNKIKLKRDIVAAILKKCKGNLQQVFLLSTQHGLSCFKSADDISDRCGIDNSTDRVRNGLNLETSLLECIATKKQDTLQDICTADSSRSEGCLYELLPQLVSGLKDWSCLIDIFCTSDRYCHYRSEMQSIAMTTTEFALSENASRLLERQNVQGPTRRSTHVGSRGTSYTRSKLNKDYTFYLQSILATWATPSEKTLYEI